MFSSGAHRHQPRVDTAQLCCEVGPCRRSDYDTDLVMGCKRLPARRPDQLLVSKQAIARLEVLV